METNIYATEEPEIFTGGRVYIGDAEGVAHKVKSVYIGVLTDVPIIDKAEIVVGHETKEVARKVKKAYIGADGIAQLCYTDGGG